VDDRIPVQSDQAVSRRMLPKFARPLMSHWYTSDRYSRALAAAVFLCLILCSILCLALPAGAQDRAPATAPPGTQNVPATLTGKERLGRKWMDEQRIDNCNVPPGKRGSKPRPSGCPHTPTG
jgi:hypothetical protein